jgi:hypothetical protein
MSISKWASGEKTDGERFLQTLIIAGGSGCAGRHDAAASSTDWSDGGTAMK